MKNYLISAVFTLMAIFTTLSFSACGGTTPKQNESNGSDNDSHEYVDLGLPSGLLWATCNVGASEPEECGDYFAWGETKPKSDYSWNTYKWGSDERQLTKYCTDSGYGKDGFTDNKTTLDLADDAARANWGGQWRMPTKEDFEELINNTSSKWISDAKWISPRIGGSGYVFTASNGNYLFLPDAGCRYGKLPGRDGSPGYWSSSLGTECPDGAYYLFFDPDLVHVQGDRCRINENDCRLIGRPVRPVRPKN